MTFESEFYHFSFKTINLKMSSVRMAAILSRVRWLISSWRELSMYAITYTCSEGYPASRNKCWAQFCDGNFCWLVQVRLSGACLVPQSPVMNGSDNTEARDGTQLTQVNLAAFCYNWKDVTCNNIQYTRLHAWLCKAWCSFTMTDVFFQHKYIDLGSQIYHAIYSCLIAPNPFL